MVSVQIKNLKSYNKIYAIHKIKIDYKIRFLKTFGDTGFLKRFINHIPLTIVVEGFKMADLGFEQKLWITADKMRNNMDAAEYKHVVLGLIFLKYISDAFIEVHSELEKSGEDAEDIDEYKSRNIFWVPPEAR